MSYSNGPKLVTNGLVLYLDAANPKSYIGSGTTWNDLSGNGNHFTLYNSPTYVSRSIRFDGTNQYGSSTNNIDLSGISQSITIEVTTKPFNSSSYASVYEHSTNWNSNIGGFGMYLNLDGNFVYPDMTHTNHNPNGANNVYARNYEGKLNSGWSFHTNILSKVSDVTGRITYFNGNLVPFSSLGQFPNPTTTSTSDYPNAFGNYKMYLASRGGSSAFSNLFISSLRIYNRKLSAAEILQNYNSTKGRFGL